MVNTNGFHTIIYLGLYPGSSHYQNVGLAQDLSYNWIAENLLSAGCLFEFSCSHLCTVTEPLMCSSGKVEFDVV